MSYILDALKKAERERGTGRLPWLTRAQDPLEKRRNRLAKIAGGLLVCAVVVLLLRWPFPTDFMRRPKPVPVAAEPAQPAIGSEPGSAGGPGHASPTSAPLRPEVAPAAPLARHRQGTVTPAAPEARSSSRPDAASASEAATRLPDSTGQNAPDHGRRPTPVTPGESPSAPQTAGVPPIEAVTPGADSNASNTRTKESVPPPAVPTAPVSLEEAVARMTLNMLVYEEAETNRRVYINGKKYMKGDLVEGKYLIEEITKEGATLSFEGARTTLRPR